jgi:stress response protein YsnF
VSDQTPEDGPLKRITAPKTQVLPLYAESVVVTKHLVETARVCASRTTHTRQQVVEEQLAHELVEVLRIPMNLTVAAVPPIRQEGDTTILSVVEEVVVVERRLVLREEVHFRRVRKVENHVETVTLREQTVVVTRTDIRSKNNVEPPSETSL